MSLVDRVLQAIIAVVVTLATPAIAQKSEHVFKIIARGCQGHGVRVQTGFRLAGSRGIYTALHGVNGCRDILAQSEGSQDVIFAELAIYRVDVARDVAVLVSDKLKKEEALVGLRPARTLIDVKSKGLIVFGYPRNIDGQLPTSAKLREPARVPLWSLLPAEARDTLLKLKSPEINQTVLSIEGHLAPGHSGAPVVIGGSDEVVGIVNGGVDEGRLEISWAFAIQDLELVREREARAQMRELDASGIHEYFLGLESRMDAPGVATIALWRKAGSCFGVPQPPIDVLIDNEMVGVIEQGTRRDFEVPDGKHFVRIRYDWYKTEPVVVDMRRGETVNVKCGFKPDCVTGGVVIGDYLFIQPFEVSP